MARLREAARQNHIHVVMGYSERSGSSPEVNLAASRMYADADVGETERAV